MFRTDLRLRAATRARISVLAVALTAHLLPLACPAPSWPVQSLPDSAGSGIGGQWSAIVPRFRARGHSAVYDPKRDRMIVFGGFDGRFQNDTWELPLSKETGWKRLITTGGPPPPREGHAAVYDPVGDQIVLIGGSTSDALLLNDVWVLSLGDTSTWVQLSPQGLPPTPRFFHTAVFDPIRDRVLIFGGADWAPYLNNDVWSLSLREQPAWDSLATSGTPPFERFRHASIYDPARDRMVVVGGDASGAGLNDAWSLWLGMGTPTWSPIVAGGAPPPRIMSHSAVLDPDGDRIVVFGGWTNYPSTVVHDSTWTLDLSTSTWTNLAPAGERPTARSAHSAILDPLRDRMLVFGGTNTAPSSGEFQYRIAEEVAALSLAGPPEWSFVVEPVPLPSAWDEYTAIHDPVRDRMIIFGSPDPNPWALRLDEKPRWVQLDPGGPTPFVQWNHAAVYDPVGDQMIVFGGFSACCPDITSETWLLSLGEGSRWSLLDLPEGPSDRSAPAAIYDPARKRMIVFGGLTLAGLSNETWALSIPSPTSSDPYSWKELVTVGTTPSPRWFAGAVYDPVQDRMLVIGGYPDEVQSEIWSLTLGDQPTWTRVLPEGPEPSSGWARAAFYDQPRRRVVLFGGARVLTLSDETWALTLGAQTTWQRVPTTGVPPQPRNRHTAIHDQLRDRMLIFGGYPARNDTWALSFDARPYPESEPSGLHDQPSRIVSGRSPAAMHESIASLAFGPNPSRGQGVITFSLSRGDHVHLRLLDASGRLIDTLVDRALPSGTHAVDWRGSTASGQRVAAGVYFLRLETGGPVETKRITVMR
jgi:Galactose oxidase, central domain/FlgD Ig-like domain